MEIRYFNDPETGLPHIYDHNVDEQDVFDVLRRPIENRKGDDETRVCMGQTRAGRYLRVIYKREEMTNDIFVITAYDLTAKQLRALKRRHRHRPL